MQNILQERLKKLATMPKNWATNLKAGVEKEILRTDLNANLSQIPHSKLLGSTLTHTYITTDYSESLLELITPPVKDHASMLDFLLDLHAWTAQNLEAEQLLWTHSMPCGLPENDLIPIANYGSSNQGKMRSIYRKGLDLRYGRSMQTIAGLHYNFSLPSFFWQLWQEILHSEGVKLDATQLESLNSHGYFALIRNFRRYAWLILYLFGATPSVDETFVKNLKILDKLTKLDATSYGLPNATSLRMSSIGYQNPAQKSLNVCFNNLNDYTKSLMRATSSLHPEYAAKGVIKNGQYLQLNANILQIENEFYSDIRPKRSTPYTEQPSRALMRDGVEYIEVRNLDINPFILGGIDLATMDFLDLFLLFCLLTQSDYIEESECNLITANKNLITLEGRRKNLQLKYLTSSKSLADSGLELLQEMQPLAEFLDAANNSSKYTSTLQKQMAKFKQPELTPSAIWLDFSKDKGFLAAGLELATQQMQELRQRKISKDQLALFKQLSETSLKMQQELEANKDEDFATYLANYFAN